MVNLGDVMPNFKATTNEGEIQFHDWIGDSWAILFSHPADFTPVCTTELAKAQSYSAKFAERGVKMIALSCDSAESHTKWIDDIKQFSAGEFSYPIIADEERKIAISLGMLDPDEKDSKGMPLTCRAVFIIGPDKKLKLSLLYPATTGRNFDEIIRVIDSLKLTIEKKVATPANWKMDDEAMVIPSLSDEVAKQTFPGGFRQVEVPSKKCYMRFTTDYK